MFPLLICVPLHINYVFRYLDITLIIRYILWDVYHMLTEQHVVVPL
jgi:hypothetical protein